ncbi:uncharacterized protein LOC114755607 [Neltuma alba]|uniref:uncharacterized protein LOC114755607 n=1 Tax=Neltuma alba TaxID=207710 RepID=UPI0010A481CE|nr:uncharacterized protein LOC114755607 [Prosopis alba]
MDIALTSISTSPNGGYSDREMIMATSTHASEKPDNLNGFRGGVWVSWTNENFSIKVLEMNDQYIHVVAEKNDTKIYVTSVYASPNSTIRRSLWGKLTQLDPGNQWPWFIGGDFNATLFYHERKSNAAKKRDKCESRIDRVISNSRARSTFIDAIVKNLPWFKSDHHPILLQLRLVKENWNANSNWNENVDSFTKEIIDWSKNVFGHIGKKKSILMGRLEGISPSISNTSISSSLEQLQKKLWLELEKVIIQAELLWAQKAKCD